MFRSALPRENPEAERVPESIEDSPLPAPLSPKIIHAHTMQHHHGLQSCAAVLGLLPSVLLGFCLLRPGLPRLSLLSPWSHTLRKGHSEWSEGSLPLTGSRKPPLPSSPLFLVCCLIYPSPRTPWPVATYTRSGGGGGGAAARNAWGLLHILHNYCHHLLAA